MSAASSTKFNMDYLNSTNYKETVAKEFMTSLFIKVGRIIIYLLAFIALIIILSNHQGAGILKAFLYFFISLSILLLMLDIFINFRSTSPEKTLNEALISPQENNLIEFFERENVGKLIFLADKLRKKYQLTNISPLLLLLTFSKLSLGRQLLLRSEMFFDEQSEKDIVAECKNLQSDSGQNIFSAELEEILAYSLEIANEQKRNYADLADIFLSLVSKNATIAKLLDDKGLKLADLEDLASWYRRFTSYLEKKYFWQKEYYGRGIGQDWASGYTPVLNYYAKDISEFLLDAKFQLTAQSHKQIISSISEALIKSGGNNVVLVGEKGVGKKNIVNAFAQQVVRGQTLPALRYKHIVELNISQFLAVANEGELQQRFVKILNEIIHSGNIILFIDGLENLVNPRVEQLGTVDASQFLIPYLKSNHLQIITTTDPDSWHKKIEANRALAGMFTKIEVVEPPVKEMMPILEDSIIRIELESQVFFTYLSLKNIISLTDRFIHDEVFPQKAIELAQSMSAKFTAGSGKLTVVNAQDVQDYVAERFKVPAKEASGGEKEKLINLEQELHQRIIDQEEAITSIANAMRRARAGLSKKNKPIGSFLFVGPTGVGKTETVKALAEIYFGSEKNMVRFDMSEFQQIESLDLLLGSATSGEAEQGRLSVAIRENPYTVLLFDEVEKAHPNILNLFLQMLDEGTLTDATGRKLDFTNAIIIATSNAGAEEIRQYIKTAKPLASLSSYILDYLQSKALFRPEFLNRFDAIICFKPLLPEHILAVAKLMIGKLKEKLHQEKDITLQVDEKALSKLAQLGYNPELGARPMARVIQDKLENLLAQKLLKEEIKKGDTVNISEQDIS